VRKAAAYEWSRQSDDSPPLFSRVWGSRPLSDEEFGCGDGLAGMTLGVVRNVDQQAAKGGRQGFLADRSGLLQVLRGKGQDALCAISEGCIKLTE
jgi:hypothetical protein